jgi:hypothetical protein
MVHNFKTFIVESRGSSEEKLTHLEHAEDHPFNAGAAGYEHAKKTLSAVHGALTGKKSNATITTKYDGSPSIVFGHHPETGKFFVASKSAFNKTPKINYTAADVDANHGHAPGLADKLKTALKHLPKVTPKTGIYQGDVMHSGGEKGDVQMHGGQAHFKPNTITYTTKRPGEAEQAAKSKIGVAVHTKYEGPSFDKMKAQYNAGHQGFGTHKDVHLLDVTHKATGIKPEQTKAYEEHMAKAAEAHKALGSEGYKAIEPHSEHLKTYINKTVRTGEAPSVKGYQSHITDIHKKAEEGYKTEAKKQQVQATHQQMQTHIVSNQHHFENALALHSHLQGAKNELVHALSAKPDYGHSVGNQKVKPEGHVAVINNRPTKLVDRAEFSRLNFAKNAK